MIRAIAGVLHRAGAPDDAGVASLRHAVTAEAPGSYVAVVRSGALALACSGGDPFTDGAGLCVLDGVIDAGLGAGAADDVLGADHGRRLERAAFEDWRGRDDALAAELRGDHALLLWDGGRGVLIRDQIGGRIWVVHDDGARMFFATEVSTLLAVLDRRPGVDGLALTHWLSLSGMPRDRTLYEGVVRLEAGHLLELDPSSRHAPHRYWSPAPPAPSTVTMDDAATQLRTALTTSMARRSAGPGATALQLSGGLDSATVAAIGSRLPADLRPRRAYSAVFPGHPSVDEDALIGQTAESAGTARTSAVVKDGSVIAGSLAFLERWALPPVSPNLFFWTPMLEQAAADGIAVMLDGEGGDELFGLSPYLIADKLRHGNVLGAARQVRRVTGASPALRRREVLRYMRTYGAGGLAPPWSHALSRRLRRPARYVPAWIGKAAAREYVAAGDGAAWKRVDGPRWWAHLLEATTRGMGPALLYDHARRRAAMSGGLLARHPLMDVDVIELVLALPPELAFDPARSRPVVREAIKGLVPDPVRLRPEKSSFGAVFEGSLAGGDRAVVKALLTGPDVRLAQYADMQTVRTKLVDDIPRDAAGRALWAQHTWRLATAELFLRLQEDSGAPRRVVESAGAAAPRVTFRTG